ncbi:unnamed protein product [Candidula unifasciata]|uniref:XK-related protein n=1 Tax=Candidula unifasciata TaxID=100452 RepID=A0A8S3ZVW0_9EUPU|nr:unnamed protein product [Candidula unifasciata]
MTSRIESKGSSVPQARVKIISSKRDYFNIDKMQHSYGSGSLFVDNDASDEDLDSDKENPIYNNNAAGMETDNAYNSEDEELPVSVSKSVMRLTSSSSNNNESVHRLLPVNVGIEDDESIRASFINSIKIESSGATYKSKVADGNHENIDFVDMAISRDACTDLADADSTQVDAYKQKQQRKLKYTPKTIKNIAKEKNQSKLKPSVSFGWFDVLIGIVAVTLFFVDIGTDIELAVHYFRNRLWVYGGVTTGFIVGPSLVTCFLGLHWYLLDYNKEKEVLERLEKLGKKSKAYKTPGYVWFLRFFFTLLQCGPVIRVIEYLFCGYKSRSKDLDIRERKRYYRLMLYEDVDSCLLRLFESFLEAAPQLTWQLYIVIDLKPKEDVVGTSIRALALLSSWGSLAISLTSYHKSLRNSHEEKAKMSLKSLPFYFIWRACETGGRILCISMFASAFRLWVFGPIAFHWAFMSGWLIIQRTAFYKNKCLEKVFNVICGYVMIFCFLNVREGQTRFRFMLFYIILYIENFMMLGLWFRYTQDLGAWFHLWGFIVILLLFVFHVVFQLLYYMFFHPTRNIKMCPPCSKSIICSSICYEVQPSVAESDSKSERLAIEEIVVVSKVRQTEGND